MIGRITRGTTYQGRALNEGEVVDLPEHDFYQFKLTGDIGPLPDKGTTPETEPPAAEPTSNKKKK